MSTSFKLLDEFVDQYHEKQVPWGFGINGNNSIGEITFIRTYSRNKQDGTKERWWEVCQRVINGIYSIQKDHVKKNKLPWNDRKAQASAQEAFDRMFNLKWTPPGRGLWMMGSDFIMEREMAGALQNCAMISTADIHKSDPGAVFAWVMDALMLGVGVGFDTLGANRQIMINNSTNEFSQYVIPDTREGWAESVRLLLNSMLRPDMPTITFNYSEIREAGEPIKGFGGVSSGPAPLKILHNQLREVIGTRAGEYLDSRAIVDIVNLIGTCVVAGNVRRSATLALGSPQDKEFINLKNADFFPERNSYDPDNPGWGWMSNNSIVADDITDFTDYTDLISENGEPGFIWLNRSRSYGRLKDEANYKDWRVAGYNPCLVGDTWILTSSGPRQIKELINKSFEAIVHGKPYKSEGFWKSGTKPVYNVMTDEGFSLKATADHRISTPQGWVEVQNLTTDDELIIGDHIGFEWPGAGSFDEGYVVGHWLGDGTLTSNKAILEDWYESSESTKLIEKYAMTLPHRSDFNGWCNNERSRRLTLKSLTEQIFKWTDKKIVSDEIERASSNFYKGFLSGWFDTDGHVEGLSTGGGTSIRLSSTNYDNLAAAQRMLARLGIMSKIRKMHPEGNREMPDGKGGKKNYFTKESYRLIISGKYTVRFLTEIGFVNRAKSQKLEQSILNMKRGFYNKPMTANVLSITQLPDEDVFDATVEEMHAFDANGIVVHNCAEQSLESYECCTLVEVHLNNHDSFEDLKRSLKFAYLYGKTVTLLPTEWEQTNAVMQRNRRIGASLTGIANFADKHGIPTTKKWMDDGYEVIKYYDRQYSEWLGIRESIKTTTVKPSGTVSLLSGASPGVHWSPGGQYYLRAIRFANNDKMLPVLEAAGYRTEPAVQSANTTVVYFPVETDTRSEREVTIFEKMHLATIAQRYWSDNAVSVTVSFDKEQETKYLSSVMHMFGAQLKTVSFLPMGNDVYPQQPYTSITRDEYEEYARQLKIIDWSGIYENYDDAAGEKFCSNDSCLL